MTQEISIKIVVEPLRSPEGGGVITIYAGTGCAI